jgi:hypothetical protein
VILIAKVDGDVLLAALLSGTSLSVSFRFLGLPIGNLAEYMHVSDILEHLPQDGYPPSHLSFFCPLQIDQHISTPDVSGKCGLSYCTDHRKLSYWQDLVVRGS